LYITVDTVLSLSFLSFVKTAAELRKAVLATLKNSNWHEVFLSMETHDLAKEFHRAEEQRLFLSHPLGPLIATGNISVEFVEMQHKSQLTDWRRRVEAANNVKRQGGDRSKFLEELKTLQKFVYDLAMTDEIYEMLSKQENVPRSQSPSESSTEGATSETTETRRTPQMQPPSPSSSSSPSPSDDFELDTNCIAAASYYFPVTQYVTSHFGIMETGITVPEDVRIQNQQSLEGQFGEVRICSSINSWVYFFDMLHP
jgi:hypothetical protein